MPGRSRPTFTKRQKEHARQEKQRAKMQRKLQRKLEKQAGGSSSDDLNIATPEETSAMHDLGGDKNENV